MPFRFPVGPEWEASRVPWYRLQHGNENIAILHLQGTSRVLIVEGMMQSGYWSTVLHILKPIQDLQFHESSSVGR
jgi:hypothetical protein